MDCSALQFTSQHRGRDIKHNPMLCRANTEGFDDVDGEDDDGFDWCDLLHVTSSWRPLCTLVSNPIRRHTYKTLDLIKNLKECLFLVKSLIPLQGYVEGGPQSPNFQGYPESPTVPWRDRSLHGPVAVRFRRSKPTSGRGQGTISLQYVLLGHQLVLSLGAPLSCMHAYWCLGKYGTVNAESPGCLCCQDFKYKVDVAVKRFARIMAGNLEWTCVPLVL